MILKLTKMAQNYLFCIILPRQGSNNHNIFYDSYYILLNLNFLKDIVNFVKYFELLFGREGQNKFSNEVTYHNLKKPQNLVYGIYICNTLS